MRWFLAALSVLAMLAPTVASAHPHIWISQHVRVIVEGGKITHFELEWRFDPDSSEGEIQAVDEDSDGKVSMIETKSLADDMLPELEKVGYQTWLNTGANSGAKDFHPPQRPTLVARIDDPASFTPPDWDHNDGDKDAGMPMPENKQVKQPEPHSPRNLVYVMRFALAQPAKTLSIVTYDSEDFIRFEVDKASLPKACTLDKHPTYKSEFVPGKPVFADRVSCKLP
jgi:ABC-type uncharacterized transport system substrate-binding protein